MASDFSVGVDHSVPCHPIRVVLGDVRQLRDRLLCWLALMVGCCASAPPLREFEDSRGGPSWHSPCHFLSMACRNTSGCTACSDRWQLTGPDKTGGATPPTSGYVGHASRGASSLRPVARPVPAMESSGLPLTPRAACKASRASFALHCYKRSTRCSVEGVLLLDFWQGEGEWRAFLWNPFSHPPPKEELEHSTTSFSLGERRGRGGAFGSFSQSRLVC